ncbi:MAG TPA: nucleotidyl transferase AbiEii/AbiGii toxin family protein [Baekduia sp.]|uniref:nucleotidyl transferase AbiEii/AbiGii toxin family protein n=1 Tax=Baekduia sp. TaxID=2600305 RepID=UPI002CEC468B|nr:nucleotidyl transferase AbiEii/AbiGii toxin family protein [Baekduia sp.]HMJ35322.1 nucleotidyl transferase AbiEii/AbiGii toxin family protein [Baekduia sp.]
MHSVPQIIEYFHLAFLDVLRTRVDVSRYVVKGGANLRYFFDSVRYSEDIDLDIYGLEADWKFEEQVDNTLSGDALTRLLRSAGITIDPAEIAKPKQTTTTRRWKVLLTAAGHSDKVRTKVEFSNRNGETRFQLDAVPDSVAAPYAMRPPSVQHYLLEPATEQKVVALALRPETQARDVFDLDVLMRRGGLTPGAVDQDRRNTAAEAAVALTWDDFQSQVAPFLDPAVAELYDQVRWNQIQDYVAGELLK